MKRNIGADIIWAFLGGMAFSTDAISKVHFEFFIDINDLKVPVLNENIAGETVDEVVEIQPWCSVGAEDLFFERFTY